MRHARRLAVLSPFVLAFPIAADARAQWASTALTPGGELVAAEGWLAHRGTDAWRVFSAATRTWSQVATPAHELVASGAHVALFAQAGELVAYDALDGTIAPLSVETLAWSAAGRDVVAAVESEAGGFTVHVFGAATAAWSAQPIASAALVPANVSLDDGVVAVKDGDSYHGFAGRLGAWTTLALAPGTNGADPIARGEIALAYLPEPSGGGIDRMVGFSGVVGAFDVVGDLHFSSSTLLGRHVALVRVQHPILTRFFPSGFSAYTGTWVTAPEAHVPTSVVQYAGESIVALENIGFATNLHVFHAAPATWSLLPGQRTVVGVEGDTLVAEDPATGALTGASGLVAGFAHVASVSPHGLATGSEHLALVANGDFAWRAFSPASGTWTELVDGVEFANAAAVASLVDGGGQARAFSARAASWALGPVLAPGSTTVADGSLLAWQDAVSGAVHVFDGRRGVVLAAPLPGVPVVTGGRRSLVAWSESGEVWAYSARRGDWAQASGAALDLPFDVQPSASGDVAWYADGAGQLWAFGAGRDVEPAQDWPDGPAVVAPPPEHAAGARLIVHGAPGELALLFAATELGPPLPLPGFDGWMELGLASAWLLAVDTLDAAGTWHLELPLPDGLPVGLRVWLQSVAFDPLAGTWRFGAGAADLGVF